MEVIIRILLQNPVQHLREQKLIEKGSYSFYNSELDKQEMTNLELELDLKNAMKYNELDVFFQPKVDPVDKSIKGFESLIRWHRYHKEWISPSVFIPISEENGQIVELGYFVIEKACDFIMTLQKLGMEDFHVGINVSAKQFSDAHFIDNLITIVENRGIDPRFVDLEITESITASKVFNTIESLTRLSDYGFSISIDDFGTGYSSLQYLLSLPFDTIKIDKSFIDQVIEENGNLTVLNTMISLAHSLNKHIVAEGVETEEQVKYLTQENCPPYTGVFLL